MALIGNLQGIGFASADYKVVNKLEGLSFDSSDYKVVSRNEGLSFASVTNVYVIFVDSVTLLPVSVYCDIFNLDYPADLFTNGNTNFTASTHSFLLENDTTIQIDVNQAGYEPFTDQYLLDSEIDNEIVIYLIPQTIQNLICDSFIGTSTGFETNAIIKKEGNFLFCDFTIPSFISENDWSIVFSGFPLNGDKKSGQNYTAIYFGIVGTNKYRWRAELSGLEDNYGFTARIRKKT